MNIIVLATAWGPRNGGINSFNMDFVKGLASFLGNHGNIICGVPYATDQEIMVAKEKSNVTILHANMENYQEKYLPRNFANTFMGEFKKIFTDIEINYWIGHDIITGEAAILGAQQSSIAKSVFIAHMNYRAYKSYADGNGAEALKLANRQERIARDSDYVFANGTYLQKVFKDQLGKGKEVGLLIPGFANIHPDTCNNELRVITTGRLDDGNDRVKQTKLAVAGFGAAIKYLSDALVANSTNLKDMPKGIVVLGVEESGGNHERTLRELAAEKAGKQITINCAPYTEDRNTLYYELKKANIALMPSWHDGFGLAGWEAIAAETPLILGRNSGLWDLISGQFISTDIAAAHIKLIEIEGNLNTESSTSYSENDVKNVSTAIVEIASNLQVEIKKARELKQVLDFHLDCSWEKTAERLLSGLGLKADGYRDNLHIKRGFIESDSLKSISGNWVARYIEGSLGDEPKIIEEKIHLKLSNCGKKLEGSSMSISRKDEKKGKDEIRESLQNFEVVNGILIGESKVEDWLSPAGFSRFQLACTKNGNVLDGVVSWVSAKTGLIDWSRYIMIRPDTSDSEIAKFVDAEMESELREFKTRISHRHRFSYRQM